MHMLMTNSQYNKIFLTNEHTVLGNSMPINLVFNPVNIVKVPITRMQSSQLDLAQHHALDAHYTTSITVTNTS